MITTVSTTAELTAALKGAHGGDTIQLASGNYGAVTLSGLNFTTDVTIVSQNASAEATLTGLNVKTCSGITFQNLEFVATPAAGAQPFVVNASKDIHFDGLNVHGSLDGDPTNDTGGILIRSSTDVSVTHSEFSQLYWGLAHLDDSNLTVSDNVFHDIRMDGVRGGGSSNVLVARNTFHDFHMVALDHPDAIQFWTGNTTSSAHDIRVEDNSFVRGAGDAIQGVFMRDEVGGLPFQHVTITGNLIEGGMYNSIAVLGGSDVTIDHNTVQGFSDMRGWIRLENIDGVTVSNNETNILDITSTVSHAVVASNTIIAQASDGGAATLATWTASQTAVFAVAGLNLVGTAGNDTLMGGGAADTLAGGAGTDLLTGGSGDDLYVIDGKAAIVEQSDGGTDAVQSSISYTLPTYVENLTLTGAKAVSGQGNASDNAITGNDAANQLIGRQGDDVLSGHGGADTLNGGQGTDHLFGGAGADVFVFAKGDGADVIHDFGLNGEHDALDLSALYAAGLTATLTDGTAGVTVGFTSGDSIVLLGVHASDLHATSTGYIF